MIFVIIEGGLSFIAREWINAFFQFGLLVLIMVVLICNKANNERARLLIYQGYAIVLLLNLIELIAMSIVFLEVFDYIKELCEELEDEPSTMEMFQFKSMVDCDYNIRIMLTACIVTGSLVYFPIKIHFMLVLRSHWKKRRE